MEPIRVITGTAAPLDRSDVDTDQIIPSDWLKRVERTGFGRGLFSEWRDSRDFVLNDEQYAGATILVAGSNFGTGSSREHAVWALSDYGFRAVVSSRVADIFRGNAGKQGLVAAECAQSDVELLWKLLEAEPGTEVTVDLRDKTVRAKDFTAPFQIDDYTRWRLLEGLDDIALTLRHSADIGSFEEAREPWKPVTTTLSS